MEHKVIYKKIENGEGFYSLECICGFGQTCKDVESARFLTRIHFFLTSPHQPNVIFDKKEFND
jgi:hypothetical protein